MSLEECFRLGSPILMEGALGERLKREYSLEPDEYVALAAMVYSKKGEEALYRLWSEYLEAAKQFDMPFLATTPTRRANKERVRESPYDENILQDNVNLLKRLRDDFPAVKMYAGGLMGCAGDAYRADHILKRQEAREFHGWQAELFRKAGVDFLYAGIMPALEEALGMADAMAETGLPYIISFMLGSDGCLIDKTRLADAMEEIDSSVKQRPLCFMTNCVHPAIIRKTLSWDFNDNAYVRERFRGIQPNTSPLSPDELDGSKTLEGTEPLKLAEEVERLLEKMNITICGGCCGTDARHLKEMARVIKK
ncbi:homocysteine S-methyltransferase family protein [Anaerocolumna jejuensis]|uniref:homocysteine S-methyltransferase family protein n=1 Tax=Anaerocolumna jejuensis TaxID=259063 RepID=UPI003F7BC16C